MVDQADHDAVALCNERIHRNVLVEEPSPGRARDLQGQGGFAGAAVKGVIAVPKGKPGVEVGLASSADASGRCIGGQVPWALSIKYDVNNKCTKKLAVRGRARDEPPSDQREVQWRNQETFAFPSVASAASSATPSRYCQFHAPAC